MVVDKSDEIVAEIRKIIRAVDLHSKSLSKTYGLTGPQLMILTEIGKGDEATITELARRISLSQATVTSIIDRLEQKGMVRRNRNQIDKRKVQMELTEDGREILLTKPSLLQVDFVNKFDQLENWEQSLLISSLQHIARMMGADDTKVAPLLTGEAIPEE